MKLLILTLFVFFIKVYGGENKLLPCNCRLGNLNRIINGEIAKNHSIPWMASLTEEDDFHFCGGSIVNEKYILTAASCLIHKTAEDIKVRVGVNSILNINEANTYNATKIIIEKHKWSGSDDFAIIELDRPIEFEPGKVEPACLNLKDDNFYEDDLLIAGWGDIGKPWEYEKELMRVTNYTINIDGNLRYYYSTQAETCRYYDICTIPKKENATFCFGDAGGPLMHTKNGKTYVVGINSKPVYVKENDKFIGCSGITEHPRLKTYKDFIKNIAKNYCSFKYKNKKKNKKFKKKNN